MQPVLKVILIGVMASTPAVTLVCLDTVRYHKITNDLNVYLANNQIPEGNFRIIYIQKRSLIKSFYQGKSVRVRIEFVAKKHDDLGLVLKKFFIGIGKSEFWSDNHFIGKPEDAFAYDGPSQILPNGSAVFTYSIQWDYTYF